MSRCCLTIGLFLGLLVPSFQTLTAADVPPVYDPSDVPLLPDAVRQAMQDRNFAEARKAIDEAAKAKDAASDYLAYLRAWSFYLDKQHDQAIAALEKFEKEFPQSTWLRRARFAKAQAMVAKGDFRGAQAIYEQEAKYLLSQSRKQQSALVYREFGDARFEPRRQDQQPDYKSAREFYALALNTGLAAPERVEVEFRMSYCLQKLGLQGDAAAAYEKFLAANVDNPRNMEVRYRLGECLLAAGKLAEARKAWRELLKMAVGSTVHPVLSKNLVESQAVVVPPGHDVPTAGAVPPKGGTTSALSTTHAPKLQIVKDEAVHDWPAEAAFHLAETWHCPSPANDEDLRRGVAALEDFIKRFPTHKLAPAAHLQIAKSQLHRAHYDQAIATFQQFLKDPRWKDCKELPQARVALGQVYQAQKKYAEALAIWREYLVRDTAHEDWNAVQQSIIDTEYLIGFDKFEAGDDAAASKLLTEFVDRYPLDSRDPGILSLFGQMHFRQKNWDAAIADWQRLAAKYPRSEEASHAQFMIAATLAEKLNRFDEAREHYRLVTGRDAAAAQAALQEIPAKRMQVKTQRVFRSSETPQLQLATRNIPSVKVRLYKIDLETYFRKMHSIAGIQRLDVSLIDPDTNLEFAVPDYVKYKPLTSSIPVPLPDGLKAGVAAVTVSSPSLETTTLLIQSDLEILVKSSRDEVLIFAENVVTGKPWPGVRLLISDGQSVLAEAKTGEDGFFRQPIRHPALKDTAQLSPNRAFLFQWGSERNPGSKDVQCLRVFAIAQGGHVASTALRLDGESVGHELADDRIFVDTDRASYFAGETVHVHGCARHADGGHFTLEPLPGSEALPTWTQRHVGSRFVVEPGKKLTIEVLGDADRRLRRREVTLSAAGTFSFDFLLPEQMPQGSYKVVVRDQAGHRQFALFQIDRPESEALHLDLDMPRSVYYRDEVVEGTLRAVLPQDRPLAAVKVNYKLGAGPAFIATTDARGEAHFVIPTAELESFGRVVFEASIPSRSVSLRRVLTVATQGFWVGLDTARSIYIAGESFDVGLKTTDAADRPSAEKLLFKVFRRNGVGETSREELVEEHPLVTAVDGKTHQTLKLSKGGLYVIRATGTDRFGNTVAGEMQLTVSGDDDSRQLLLLVDRKELKAGDTAEAQIYWRGQPALAVVTCHFDRLIQQRQISLQPGKNRLQIPVTADMAPGFTLGVSVMADRPADKTTVGDAGHPLAGHGVPLETHLSPSRNATEGVPYSREARLHTASCAFSVDADLQVKVECHRHGDAVAAPQPGEPVDVTVTTCDARGNPVAAEVSLAMLPADRADLDALSGKSLAGFFGNRNRAMQFQTASSIQFHYQPPVRATGNAEPEEEGAAIPPHIAAQRGVRVGDVKPADDNPFGDPSPRPPESQRPESIRPDAANPFGDSPTASEAAEDDANPFGGDSAKPTQNRAPRIRHQNNQRAESEAVVSPIPRPTWCGYWNPAITTGPDGRATISLKLPDDVTNLTLVARAITPDTLAGQVVRPLVLKKDLSVAIHLPPAFTDGDEVELPVVVQNQVLDKGTLEVALNVNVDGAFWSDKKTLEVQSRGQVETTFKTAIRQLQRPAEAGGYLSSRPEAVFTVTAKAGAQSDVCRRSVPVMPYGAPCRVTASGVAGGDTMVTIAPSRRHWATPTLQIAVSPTVQRSLLDLLAPAADFGGSPPVGNALRGVPLEGQTSAIRNATEGAPYSADADAGMEGLTAQSDLMAALALAKLYPANSPEGRMLDERIRTALSLLIASQRDGIWPTVGHESSVATCALAHWSLVLAGKAGYDVPKEVLDSSLARLRGSAVGDKESDLEIKAVVLHALAIAGQGDFALANHLLRDRKLLSPLGRAYLALALMQMDRKETAADVLGQSAWRAKAHPTANVLKQPEPARQVDHQPKDIEAQALTAYALLCLDPASAEAKALIDTILSQRGGLRWTPESATGPAVMAVAVGQAFQPDMHHVAAGPYHLTIIVNGKLLRTFDFDPQGPTQTVDVPLAMLVKGQQRIELHPSGAARLAYRCTLGGVDPAEFVQGASAAWSIRRSYEPGPMEIDETKIPRGFSALSGDPSRAYFSNRMTQLPVARRGSVELEIGALRKASEADDSSPSPFGQVAAGEGSSDLLVIEPLPSGSRVVPSSLDGSFDRAEILPGRIVFYLRHPRSSNSIHYELEGVFPGSNLISPTILRRAGRDAPLAVARPKSLVILPQGGRSTDPYRLTPDELLSLGTLAKRKGDVDGATRYYTELLDSWHAQPGFGLSEPAYKQTIFTLMELGMGRASPARLVQYCEVIKEKWPEEPVTLDQLLTAAGAYREIGELERSYMACRAAVEGSFTRESGVAGFLDTQGEFLRSVSQMNRLLRDYPPEPYLAEAEMELAQRVYAKAAEVQTPASPAGRGELQTSVSHEPKLARDVLIGRAGQKLDAFLTGYPSDPAADQAAFAAANARLDLKQYAEAAQSVVAYARRYPKSELLDSYWYILAYCDFATGQHTAAIDMCRKVAQAQHLDKQSGRMVDSVNKNRAIYILGQIYQSLGRRGDAIREYARVEDRIPDAKSSVNYFLRKQIALPDCTTLKPGAAAEVELSFRNIAACDVKVYRVDLMKFCEAGQALGDLSQVNLSGIRPLHEASITLRDGTDYCDHVQKLALPMKKEGAYLVVCRGEDLYASGLLLVSPLEIESRFDAQAGQMRVFVKDGTNGKYLSDVQVKLMLRQAAAQANVVGATDLRGVFVGNCPVGAATIVAQAGAGRYAYFATPPAATDIRTAVAAAATQEDDPTAPFTSPRSESADFEPLERLIRESVTTKDWVDNGGAGRLSDFPTNLGMAVSQRQAAAPATHQPERRLPPLGPNAATALSGDESPAERRIRAELRQPTEMEFVETPLKDVVDYLKDLHHIEIQLDAPALKEAGVDDSTPVTKNLKGMSLRSALKLLLDELQLKYVIHNEVLLITSPAKAESDEYMVTKAYPVTDLVLPERDGAVDFKPLEDMLTSTVATKTWVDNGGTGSISDMIVGNRALLVLSQTQEVHEEMEATLEMLRKAGGLKTAAQDVAGDEREEGERPAGARLRVRQAAPRAQRGGFGGGMGGMGGGMGGQAPSVISVIPTQQQAGPNGDADLLEGLKSSNAANQKAKVLHLKQRQDAGQNGAQGMGGGMF